MCTLIDDYVQISYRVGQKNRPPAGRSIDLIPIGIFALCGAGSRAMEILYSLEVKDKELGAAFENGSNRISGRLFAAHGGYKATWDPNHGLNVSCMECCSEGWVHSLGIDHSHRAADLRISVHLEVEWSPVKSPYAPVGEFDQKFLAGSTYSNFPVIFPAADIAS